MRALICLDCYTVEELPDYDGPPEHDYALQYVVAPHQRGGHRGQLIHVDDGEWSRNQSEILQEFWKKAGYTGFYPQFYAAHNTLKEDALKCYDKHRRPQEYCPDWKDKSKLLGNQLFTSAKEKKEIPRKELPEQKYLCQWCPMASKYEQDQVDKLFKKLKK